MKLPDLISPGTLTFPLPEGSTLLASRGSSYHLDEIFFTVVAPAGQEFRSPSGQTYLDAIAALGGAPDVFLTHIYAIDAAGDVHDVGTLPSEFFPST